MMFKILPLFFIISLCSYAQVGIGTATPHSSSALELEATDKGFLPPRLTETQRNSIVSPETGLVIYNQNVQCLQYYTGTDWFDPCCLDIVNNGISGFSFIIRIDPSSSSTVTKMDTLTGGDAGVNAADGDFIYKLASSGTGGEELVYTQGSNEFANNGHTVFQYTLEPNSISYKSNVYVSRVKLHNNNNASAIVYDFPVDYQGTFDLFLVGRMNPSFFPFISNGSFFSTSSTSGEEYSFQLGVGNTGTCNNNVYTIAYKHGGTTYRSCGGGAINANDGKFHTFNISCSDNPTDGGATKVFSFYIDNVLMDSDSTLTDYMKLNELRLFTNRARRKGAPADISQILISNSLLTTEERETLSKYMTCKYGE